MERCRVQTHALMTQKVKIGQATGVLRTEFSFLALLSIKEQAETPNPFHDIWSVIFMFQTDSSLEISSLCIQMPCLLIDGKLFARFYP